MPPTQHLHSKITVTALSTQTASLMTWPTGYLCSWHRLQNLSRKTILKVIQRRKIHPMATEHCGQSWRHLFVNILLAHGMCACPVLETSGALGVPPPLKAGKSSTSWLAGPITGSAGSAWNTGRAGVGTMPSSACASAWISSIFFACNTALPRSAAERSAIPTEHLSRTQVDFSEVDCCGSSPAGRPSAESTAISAGPACRG